MEYLASGCLNYRLVGGKKKLNAFVEGAVVPPAVSNRPSPVIGEFTACQLWRGVVQAGTLSPAAAVFHAGSRPGVRVWGR